MTEDQPGDRRGPEYRQEIHAEPGSAVYAVLHGDMHIRNGHPVYRFEPFPPRGRPIDAERVRQQPSRLLDAESRVVAFRGRDAELARLAAWRDDPAAGVSVLLVHGPGGQGKSRLAARFALDSAEQGWTVWACHHASDPTVRTVIALGDTGEALLTIVEYAERWPADDMQLFLQNPLLRRPRRARVLLVARPAESWWLALRHRLTKAGVAVGGTLALEPLAPTPAERHEVFDAARDRFCEVLEVPAAGVAAPAAGRDVLEAVEHLFPEDRDYDLDPGMAVVTEQLTRQRLTATDDPAERAVLYAALAQRLRNAGRREDATRAYENTVALYRPLAAGDPARYLPMLAGCLNNAGLSLADLRRPREALEAAAEAAGIFRRLPLDRPGPGPSLAAALATLAQALAAVGRPRRHWRQAAKPWKSAGAWPPTTRRAPRLASPWP